MQKQLYKQLYKQVYIDGFENIHFINGMIRIDTFSYVPSEDGQINSEPVERIIMTPESFINALDSMQKLAEKLVEAGVLKKA